MLVYHLVFQKCKDGGSVCSSTCLKKNFLNLGLLPCPYFNSYGRCACCRIGSRRGQGCIQHVFRRLRWPRWYVPILLVTFLLRGLRFETGSTVAKYAGANVHKRLIGEESYKQGQYELAMKRAFLGTDEDLLASA